MIAVFVCFCCYGTLFLLLLLLFLWFWLYFCPCCSCCSCSCFCCSCCYRSCSWYCWCYSCWWLMRFLLRQAAKATNTRHKNTQATHATARKATKQDRQGGQRQKAFKQSIEKIASKKFIYIMSSVYTCMLILRILWILQYNIYIDVEGNRKMLIDYRSNHSTCVC